MQSGCSAYLLPLRVRLNGGKAEVVCELVLFQVGKNDGGKGGKEGGTFVDGAVVDGVPYLGCSAGVGQ